MILAGDIGGTHTRLGLFSENGKLLQKNEYKSASYDALDRIVADFLDKSAASPIKVACFGIAGPVREGKCHATNLPWIVDISLLKERFFLKEAFLLNDLEANAWGIDELSDMELYKLNDAPVKPGNRALISVGTGLGEAGIYWDGKSFHPFATEGGHVDFSPSSSLEIKLLEKLKKKYGHVSFERVLSGSSFMLLYEFLKEEKNLEIEKDLENRFQKEDPAKVITELAVNGKSSICESVVELFCSLYGNEAGNLSLKFLPYSGLYIGGGIAPKILPFLKKDIFMKAFKNKGRFSDLLSSLPVYVILNEETALLGAMQFAKMHM